MWVSACCCNACVVPLASNKKGDRYIKKEEIEPTDKSGSEKQKLV